MSIIKIDRLTKDYGNNRGIFEVSLDVKEGEVFGFLGPNGAGKTTTIRQLMGFVRPDHGSCSILGMDCFKQASDIQKNLGYLAGEISFLNDMNGKQLLSFIADLKGIKNKKRMNELTEMFELNPHGKVKKMSKGMKQKIGIIAAFMADPEVLLLDEPTSGLDPLMQNRFIDLILSEKKCGKTIFMSSHIFEEIERTCDRTAMIRNGKIVTIEDMETLAKKKDKIFIATFTSPETVKLISREEFEIVQIQENKVSFRVTENLNRFLEKLNRYPLKNLEIQKTSLEEIFLHYYGEEEL